MKIALFDMDGTLTKPRQQIDPGMIDALDALSYYCDVGVVTGSGISYIMEQLSDWILGSSGDRARFFPCNGTQEWLFRGDRGFERTYHVSMIDEIGENKLRELCKFLLQQQLLCMSDFPEMPAAGDFIVNRESMLNYCPPGRSCSPEQRETFKDLDIRHRIRMNVFRRLNTFMEHKNSECVAALGGNTSIDIYPRGWDKTYVLKRLTSVDKISFVGDRCMEGGNDKALYDVIYNNPIGLGWSTHSVQQTIDLIMNQLIPYFSEN